MAVSISQIALRQASQEHAHRIKQTKARISFPACHGQPKVQQAGSGCLCRQMPSVHHPSSSCSHSFTRWAHGMPHPMEYLGHLGSAVSPPKPLCTPSQPITGQGAAKALTLCEPYPAVTKTPLDFNTDPTTNAKCSSKAATLRKLILFQPKWAQ